MGKLLEAELSELAGIFRDSDYDSVSQARAYVNGLVLGCRINKDKQTLFVLSSFIRAFPQHFNAMDLADLREYAVLIEGEEIASREKVGA